MIVTAGASDGLGHQLAKHYNESGKTDVNISRRECEYADHNILENLREGSVIEKATGNDNTTNEGEWMKPENLATFMKQILDLTKNMEVSEVIINRKQIK